MRKILVFFVALFAVPAFGQSVQITGGNIQFGSSGGSGGVSSIVPGTNVTCSPNVSGSCTGAVIVNSTGGGGGVPYLSGTAVFYGGSLLIVDTDDASGAGCSNYAGSAISPVTLAISQYSISGGIFTGTYTSPVGAVPVVGTHQMLAMFPTSTFLNGLIVTVTASTSTTFTGTISYANVSTTSEIGMANCAGTYPMQASIRSFLKGHVGIVNQGMGGGAVASNMIADYSTAVAPYLTATTGKPSWLFLMPSGNDFLGCPSSSALTTIENEYLTQFAWAHQDGAQVEGVTAPLNSGTSICLATLNEWMRTSGYRFVDDPVTTSATASSGSGSITVTSATGIATYQAVRCAAGTDAHTYVTGVSGTTISVSPVTTGALLGTSCVFSTGYVDHIVDMASITNNITSAIYANNPPHLNEATHQILGDYINRVMGNGGMGADSDTQGAFYGTGPVISSGYVAGGSYGGAGQIGVQENNLGGSWFAQVYHAGGTDYPWTSMGGTNTYNVIESLQGSFGSGRSRVMTKDMVIGWNSVFSYSGLGPIIESVHAGLSEDQTNGAQINAGQSGTAGDQSGGLGFSWLHTALSTANTGSCASGFGGQWSFGADGTMTRCPSGGGSWTAFGGSGGTYTGTSPIVVTGAVISCPTCSSSGIAPTTLTIATSTQAANSCTAIMGFTLTGVTTSGAGSIIEPGYQSSPSALTGWGSTGGIVLHLWPSAADTVGGEVCNQTASSITYSAITFTVGAR